MEQECQEYWGKHVDLKSEYGLTGISHVCSWPSCVRLSGLSDPCGSTLGPISPQTQLQVGIKPTHPALLNKTSTLSSSFSAVLGKSLTFSVWPRSSSHTSMTVPGYALRISSIAALPPGSDRTARMSFPGDISASFFIMPDQFLRSF